MKKSSIGLLVVLGVGYLVLKGRQAAGSPPPVVQPEPLPIPQPPPYLPPVVQPTPTPTPEPMIVTVRHTPILGIAPVTVNFETSWSNATLPFVSIHWNFGDGDASQFLNPSHVYRSAGTYSVKVELQDSAGRTGNGETVVTVFAPAPPATPPPVTFMGYKAGDRVVIDGGGLNDLVVTITDIQTQKFGDWNTGDFYYLKRVLGIVEGTGQLFNGSYDSIKGYA